ncbi:MAG: type II/IV secretion system protein [Candidatus Pacebacteria bacterium]|nr:type II/IV secretion system protein [Candidatus Paceibacterota bacterium]MBP9832389.1 type II/IV secretion system protein [Candidatus Paceibacterota bacterium]
MIVPDAQLKTFIIDSGLVSRKDFEAAERDAKDTGQPLSDALVSGGVLGEDELRRMQAHILGIPFISLAGIKIDFEVLSLIPEPIARKHNVIAYKKTADALEVAMLYTGDLEPLNFIKKKIGLKILPRLTDTASLKSALLQYQKSLKEEFGNIIQGASLSIEDNPSLDTAGLKKLADDLPVIKVVDTLLRHAIVQGASDIHIEPLEEMLLVRYRIDGILHDAMELPKNISAGVTARIKVLANLKLDEKRLPQDGRFKMEADRERVSLRVSVMPTYFGEKTVMRLLREGGGGFTLESLGFHGVALERIHSASKQSTGMILMTGPTGSGKTTTLYTILDILNTPDVNISTIEDPIEYQMPRVNQTQVRADIGFTFASGLRSLVRQDPDIIMVGEIRDTETASLAINAALTGHLVLSTLHTNSAAATIPRLMDMEAEPFLLVSTLRVIVGQRLVRRLASDRTEYILSEEEIAQLKSAVDIDRVLAVLKEEKLIPKEATIKEIPFFKPKENGVSPDGYSGRIGIHEVLPVTHEVRELILKRVSADDIELQAKREGMLTMVEDGIFKAVTGVTTIEEVLRVISE